jgi:HK97 family phage major capsid protein
LLSTQVTSLVAVSISRNEVTHIKKDSSKMSSKAIESKKNSLRILLSNQATLISRGLHSQEAKDSYAALSTQIADLESDLAMLAEIEARMAPDQAAAAQRATTDATVSVAERAASVAIRNVMPSFLPVEDNSRENIRVALRSLVRHGLSEARPEQRDLLTTSDAVGQAVIAQAYASEFLTYAKDYYAPLLNLVRTQYGTGYGTKITIASDLGVGASLVSENGPHTETDPTFSSHPVNTDLLSFGEIRFSNQLTADSGFDLIEQVLKPMYSRRFARGLEKAVLLGTDQAGTTLPNQSTGGLVAAATTTNSATASVVAADDLEVIYESLNDGYHPTAVWVMNQ